MSSLWQGAFAPERPAGLLPSLLWWLIGNAEDGPYGRFGGVHTVDDRFLPIDWKAAWQWWSRNPMHNVFFHALDIDFTTPRTIYGTPNNPQAPFWSTTGKFLFATNGGPFISYRSVSWQLYAGWRPFNKRGGGQHGVLGFAFRKRS